MGANQKVITISGVGEVTLVRNVRSKVMRIKVSAAGVKITIPQRTPFRDAEIFAQNTSDWIVKTKLKISEKSVPKIIFKPGVEFSTKFHKLCFQKSTKNEFRIQNSDILIHYINESEILSSDFQDFIRQAINEALRAEAKQFLPHQVEKLALQHGLKFRKVSVRNAKTRWGSCSGRNDISLNIQIMRLPAHLIDYVILHELCHTVHKNHGKFFWELLHKVSGNAKMLDNELKSYNTFF